MRVGITGVNGLIGWQLRCFLKTKSDVDVIPADRRTFAAPDGLDRFVGAVDAIVHLAGMNRGEESLIESTNIALTQSLIEACERAEVRPHVIFASSTHAGRDSAYGRSKKKCTALLADWSARTGAPFTNLVMPHVFGELGKPFYNSVVSTFCFQLATGQRPAIQKDAMLDLMHAQQVGEVVFGIIKEGRRGEVALKGRAMTVTELLAKLERLVESYKAQMMPDLADEIDLLLFNTYRSYLYPDGYPIALKLHEDKRGSLFEAIKSRNGGQVFISTTVPGVTRGNHYHLRKVERFLVLNGEAVIRIRKLFSDQVREFLVSGRMPCFIDIPTLHTHDITNVGDASLVTLFWANEIFDPMNPDTFPELV